MVLHSLNERACRSLQVFLELVLEVKQIIDRLLRLELRDPMINCRLPLRPRQVLIATAPRKTWLLVGGRWLLVSHFRRSLHIIDHFEVKVLVGALLRNNLW